MICNAIPASPGNYRISHNATCSCPEPLHPNRTNTNKPPRSSNNDNRPVDLLTPLAHSRREAHTFLPVRLLKDPYILQYFESYKSKALPHPSHSGDFHNSSTHTIRHMAHYFEGKHIAD
jgi:hypothetical protein